MTQAWIYNLQHHVEHLLQHTKVLHLESHPTLLNNLSALCHKSSITFTFIVPTTDACLVNRFILHWVF